jgi:hypothetical protein
VKGVRRRERLSSLGRPFFTATSPVHTPPGGRRSSSRAGLMRRSTWAQAAEKGRRKRRKAKALERFTFIV